MTIAAYYYKEAIFVGDVKGEEGEMSEAHQFFLMHGQDAHGQVGTAIHSLKLGKVFLEDGLVVELDADSPLRAHYNKVNNGLDLDMRKGMPSKTVGPH